MDPQNAGFVDFSHFKVIISSLWNNEVVGNIKEALIYCESLDDGEAKFSFKGKFNLFSFNLSFYLNAFSHLQIYYQFILDIRDYSFHCSSCKCA